MSMHTTTRILAAALVAMGTVSAHAGTASASVSNITFVLEDLDPNDGIAPSLTWIPAPADATIPGTRVRMQARLSGSGPFDGYYAGSEDAAPLASFDQTISPSNGSFHLVTSATGVSVSAEWDPVFSRAAEGSAYTGAVRPTPWNTTQTFAQLVVSPNTRVTVSALLDASVFLEDGCAGCETSSAYASAELFFTTSLGTEYVTRTVSASGYSSLLFGQHQYNPGSRDLSSLPTGTYQLSFDNTAATSQQLTFQASTRVSRGFTAPVPEPQTVVLTGIGLAAAVVIGRRRAAARPRA